MQGCPVALSLLASSKTQNGSLACNPRKHVHRKMHFSPKCAPLLYVVFSTMCWTFKNKGVGAHFRVFGERKWLPCAFCGSGSSFWVGTCVVCVCGAVCLWRVTWSVNQMRVCDVFSAVSLSGTMRSAISVLRKKRKNVFGGSASL